MGWSKTSGMPDATNVVRHEIDQEDLRAGVRDRRREAPVVQLHPGTLQQALAKQARIPERVVRRRGLDGQVVPAEAVLAIGAVHVTQLGIPLPLRPHLRRRLAPVTHEAGRLRRIFPGEQFTIDLFDHPHHLPRHHFVLDLVQPIAVMLRQSTFLYGLLLIATVVCANPAPELPTSQTRQTSPTSPNAYVGSKACEGCHTSIYQTWQSTRHAYSVLTGEEANQAGYPLPVRRQGGPALQARTWDDISYVVGGRQRISYADRSGRVLDTSYHHRTGTWKTFAAKTMTECGTCHFTGFGAGPPHPADSALPGPWAERSIGCESCHGPGERHVQTYEKQDVVVDPSSAACGRCHTAVGRVLPKDDRHDTHDTVQVWNHDPHVTGIRYHSHNAFCASCHAPYEGHFLDARGDASRRVFSEDKQHITCIGCHDPHDLTNGHYTSQQVSLEPSRPPKRHMHTGHDQDFMTTDYRELSTTTQSCLQCHRGADRIDLDHAHATCHDCHNTFHRNRGPATAVFSDANRRGLSCRQCHSDADHLISVLFGDPDFLAPKYIHNLRKLPRTVRLKYGFKYPGLEFAATRHHVPSGTPNPPDPSAGDRQATDDTSPTGQPSAAPTPARQAEQETPGARLRALWASPSHRKLAADEAIRALQGALMGAPEALDRYVELALIYRHHQDFASVQEVLAHAAAVDASRVLLTLPLHDWQTSPLPASVRNRNASALADAMLPRRSADAPGVRAVRSWVIAYLQMRRGRFAQAAEAMEAARELEPDSAALGFHLGLAMLGEGRQGAALAMFEAVIEQQPSHRGARVALGLTHLKRGQVVLAQTALETAVAADADDAIAHHVLGLAHLNNRQPAMAAEAMQNAVRADPNLLEAWFMLARSLRLSGDVDATIDVYRQIIIDRPREFRGAFEYAMLLKGLNDVTMHELRHEQEGPEPSHMDRRSWQRHLTEQAEQASRYRHVALIYFNAALDIRPWERRAIREVAEIHRQAGRFTEAQEHFEWLAHQQPGQWRHRYRLGTIHIERHAYERAIENLKHAIDLAPFEGDSYVALGLAYIATRRMADAVEVLEQGAIYQPFNPTLYNNLGAALGSLGMHDRARAALQRSLALGTFPLPRLHLAYANLGVIHWQEGRRGEAIKALKNALHVFPGYDHAQDTLRAIVSNRPVEDIDQALFVFNDLIEPFGELSTIRFDDD